MDHKFIASKSFFSTVKKAVYLVKNLWKEGTTALIHAPRAVDKSAQALSIASDLASQGRKVLYVNAEDRMPDNFKGHDNLFIFNPEHESIDDPTDYADLVFGAIEQAVRTTDIRTFVIDSVSRIAALSFGRNASAAYVMKRLVALQVKCKLSLLVVADDSTKTVNNALLSLAACELPLDEVPAEPTAEASKSEISVTEVKSTAGECHKPAPAPMPMLIPLRPLSRRERRELERRNAKRAKHTKL